MKRLIIKELIKTNLAVSSEKGNYVKDVIEKKFRNEIPVKLDFTGIDTITTSFLNSAVGDLYLLGNPQKLNQLIKIDANTLKPSQKKKVSMVMQNSKMKVNQKKFDEAIIHGE